MKSSEQKIMVTNELHWHWLSCARMTVEVGVDDQEVIRVGPPIVKRFIGQRLINLVRWMKSLGDFKTCYYGKGFDPNDAP
jgi:hypothetical protein